HVQRDQPVRRRLLPAVLAPALAKKQRGVWEEGPPPPRGALLPVPPISVQRRGAARTARGAVIDAATLPRGSRCSHRGQAPGSHSVRLSYRLGLPSSWRPLRLDSL